MEDGGPGHFGTVVQTTVDPNAYMVLSHLYTKFSVKSRPQSNICKILQSIFTGCIIKEYRVFG